VTSNPAPDSSSPHAVQAQPRACNLVLIAAEAANHEPDFRRLQEYIAEIAPEIRTFIWNDRRKRLRRWLLSTRPTFVFSPVELKRFKPVRGCVFAGNSLSKSDEHSALIAAGVPVPKHRMMTQSDPRPDVSDLGNYVVVKPDRGGRGAHVRIMRSSRAHWSPTESRIAGQSDALLAQEFIYTGPYPTSYRVTTLFGQVLWAIKVEASQTRAPLPGPDAFASHPGLSIVSNSKGCVMSLMNDTEIIAFAETAHRAFPTIPVLGIDVVRRQSDGKLFVIEVNSSGWVWHFSSPMGLRAQREFGFHFEDQFDGLRKAARILVERARLTAR